MATKSAADRLFKSIITDEDEKAFLKQQGGSGLRGLINRVIPGQTLQQKSLQRQIDRRQATSKLVEGVNPGDPDALLKRAEELANSIDPNAQVVINNLQIRAAELQKLRTEQSTRVDQGTITSAEATTAVGIRTADLIQAKADGDKAGIEAINAAALQEGERIFGALAGDPIKLRRRAVTETDAGRTLVASFLTFKAGEEEDRREAKTEFERFAARAADPKQRDPLTPIEQLKMENDAVSASSVTSTEIKPRQVLELSKQINHATAGVQLFRGILAHIERAPEDFGGIGGLRRGVQTSIQFLKESSDFIGTGALTDAFGALGARLGLTGFDPKLSAVGNLENSAVMLLARVLQGGDAENRLLKTSIDRAQKELNFQGATTAADVKARIENVLPRVETMLNNDIDLRLLLAQSSPATGAVFQRAETIVRERAQDQENSLESRLDRALERL